MFKTLHVHCQGPTLGPGFKTPKAVRCGRKKKIFSSCTNDSTLLKSVFSPRLFSLRQWHSRYLSCKFMMYNNQIFLPALLNVLF